MENLKQIAGWRNLILILLVATLQACTKKPTAEISSSKTHVNVNEGINFINTSKDAESFLWDFRDGTTTTEPNPIKSFGKPGVYPVEFTAFSKDKAIDKAILFIYVMENKSLANYFTGEHELDVTFMDSCKSGYHTYILKIRSGDTPDEVYIDNLMDKHIDGIKAKVLKVPNGYKLVTYADQEKQDNLGRTWKLVSEGDYTIEKLDGDLCLMVKGRLQRVGVKDPCLDVYFEEGADCP